MVRQKMLFGIGGSPVDHPIRLSPRVALPIPCPHPHSWAADINFKGAKAEGIGAGITSSVTRPGRAARALVGP